MDTYRAFGHLSFPGRTDVGSTFVRNPPPPPLHFVQRGPYLLRGDFGRDALLHPFIFRFSGYETTATISDTGESGTRTTLSGFEHNNDPCKICHSLYDHSLLSP